jgi:hypothetical protein
MAHEDASYADIARRVGRREDEIEKWMGRLIAGDGSGATLDFISDMLIAMGFEIDWTIRRLKKVGLPDAMQPQAETV